MREPARDFGKKVHGRRLMALVAHKKQAAKDIGD